MVPGALSSSSSSRSTNYSPYQYDMTVPQFTPDGRLLQVEYAQSAADHSTPLVAALVNKDLVVLACCRRNANTQQQRLVLLPSSSSSSSSSSTTPSGTIVLALSGVLADSLALLQTLQDDLAQQHRIFGGRRHATASRLASVVAQKCHLHALGGGRRVLGSTLLLVSSTNGSNGGVDDDLDTAGPCWTLYRTDPSGAIQTIVLQAASVESRIHILGGGSSALSLQRRLQRNWFKNKDDDTAAATLERTRLRQLLHILVEEEQSERERHPRNDPRMEGGAVDAAWPVMEVVLLSTSRGAIKLSQQQVQRLLLADE